MTANLPPMPAATFAPEDAQCRYCGRPASEHVCAECEAVADDGASGCDYAAGDAECAACALEAAEAVWALAEAVERERDERGAP